jgi:hypothetical protein
MGETGAMHRQTGVHIWANIHTWHVPGSVNAYLGLRCRAPVTALTPPARLHCKQINRTNQDQSDCIYYTGTPTFFANKALDTSLKDPSPSFYSSFYLTTTTFVRGSFSASASTQAFRHLQEILAALATRLNTAKHCLCFTVMLFVHNRSS